MSGKLFLFLVVCQIVAFAYGAVLPSTELPSTELPFAEEEEEETCGNRYADCTANEDCCGVLRCMDFGGYSGCEYPTDNPMPPPPGNAIQPPVDLLGDLGCSLLGHSCESLLDCCAPHVCTADGKCGNPDPDPFGLGGYGGYPGK